MPRHNLPPTIPIEPRYIEPTMATVSKVITMLGIYGVETSDIRDSLLRDGLSEYQAFLAYKAALMFLPPIESPPASEPRPRIRLTR